MSREIKFRAWDKKEKKMYLVQELLFFDTGFSVVVNARTDGSFEGKVRGISDKDIELFQYTGLHDKNGKEIYEGDILKGWSDLDVVEVMYISGGFWFVNKGKALQRDIEPTVNSINEHEYEVIGNIYENQELLINTKS